MDNRDNNYNDDSNTSLYLVLGGLLVVAIVFGFAYWGRHSNNNNNTNNTGTGTNNTGNTRTTP